MFDKREDYSSQVTFQSTLLKLHEILKRKKKKKLCPVQVWGLFKSKRSLLGYFQEPQSNSASSPLSNFCCFPSSYSACNRRLLCSKKNSESNRCSAECNKYIGGLGTHSIFWMENIRSRWIINNDNIVEFSPQPAKIFDVVASVKNTGFSEEPRLKHAPLV